MTIVHKNTYIHFFTFLTSAERIKNSSSVLIFISHIDIILELWRYTSSFLLISPEGMLLYSWVKGVIPTVVGDDKYSGDVQVPEFLLCGP